MDEMKKCCDCREEKKISFFYRNERGTFFSYCKGCHEIRRKKFKIRCIRCRKEFMSKKRSGYCSNKCKYEGLSVRMKMHGFCQALEIVV
jgi:hypothetical protein